MKHHRICRRSFVCGAFSAGLTYSINNLANQSTTPTKKIQTVQGSIEFAAHGVALPHEHILCDFIGADSTGKHRWDQNNVYRRMQPYVRALKQTGVSTFYDCTPAYIGRDPEILRRLSSSTGVNFVTNTGFYGGAKDKYVPKMAYQLSVEDMANIWIHEFEQGIGDTGIRPGFIKIGVDSIENESAKLSKIDATIVQAAAMVSDKTQLSVTCHTGGG